ncbi:sulfite exporter TauE/SafE family protein [Aquidulcibacter sp.]|uniref:sulfite exporter TauE/SafE family protein n=1 Tax=Aquidulcibacter sp. TaxID=2052990 RepID=UPI0037BF4D8F
MQVYLPIAEMAVSPWLMATLGLVVGCLSGIFGVGGGFLMTPLLMLMGIPAPVAVAAGANLAAASSMSSVVGQFERRGVDLRMGLVISIGGIIGVGIGSLLFSWLKSQGAAEATVRIAYTILLGSLGTSLVWESLRAIAKTRAGGPPASFRRSTNDIAHRLPFKVRFPRSKLVISIIPPLAIGIGVGILSAIMGVGGGFILIPALVYIIHMPPNLVVGTSTLQVLITASATTFLQSAANGSLDLVLSALLIVGGVMGAQFGVIIGRKLKGEQLRALLGALVLLVALRLAADLVFVPSTLFDLSSPGGGL